MEEILGVTSSVSGGGDENTDGEEAQNTSSSSSREEKDKSNWTKSLNRRFHSPQRNGESHENDVGTTDGKIGSAESFLGVANSKSPPTTEPLLRRARHSTSELEGQQAQPTESAGVKQSSSEGVLGMGVKQSSSEGVLGMGVKQKPPLPPGARGERRGLERNDKHKQPQQQQQVRGEGGEEVSVRPPVKITIEEVECAEQQRVEQVDSGTRGYIAQMRARGHKRASSAPVHYQPSLTVPHAPHIPESGGGEGKKERGRERRSKVSCVWSQFLPTSDNLSLSQFVTESEAPLVVPYLSPVVLRKEVETLITQDGSDVLGRESLVTSRLGNGGGCNCLGYLFVLHFFPSSSHLEYLPPLPALQCTGTWCGTSPACSCPPTSLSSPSGASLVPTGNSGRSAVARQVSVSPLT